VNISCDTAGGGVSQGQNEGAQLPDGSSDESHEGTSWPQSNYKHPQVNASGVNFFVFVLNYLDCGKKSRRFHPKLALMNIAAFCIYYPRKYLIALWLICMYSTVCYWFRLRVISW